VSAERLSARIGCREVLELDVDPQGDGGGADLGHLADRGVCVTRSVEDEGGLVEAGVGGRGRDVLSAHDRGRGQAGRDRPVAGKALQPEQSEEVLLGLEERFR
jgi:hypothetical protein